mmetsp:Transcript_9021/g.19060  ORF Transcript_9021/g.19060 Transcript_9021/m.19060 type:complete len:299 (+) Transcript_9021:2196-3092(+)
MDERGWSVAAVSNWCALSSLPISTLLLLLSIPQSLEGVNELRIVPASPSPSLQFVCDEFFIVEDDLPLPLLPSVVAPSSFLFIPFSLSLNQNILSNAHATAKPMQSYPPPQFKFCMSSMPFDANRNPTPICNPQTTVRGTIQLTTSMRFVTPSTNTAPPVSIPAVVTDCASNPVLAAVALPTPTSVRATAAMLFMGCTHIGTSHAYPVTTLLTPAQNSAGASAILRSRANATVRGMKVPRSPSEPESSEREKFRWCSIVRRWRKKRRVVIGFCFRWSDDDDALSLFDCGVDDGVTADG